MKKNKPVNGIKNFILSFILFTLAICTLALTTGNYSNADQAGFEVGKTWGENQKELEKSYRKAKTISKSKETKGGIQLKIKEYPLSHYEAVANTSGMSPGNDSLLNLANSLFWFDKVLVQGFDTGIQILQGTDFLKTQLNTVGGYTKTIWTQLLDSLLPIMALILMGFVTYAGFVQQSVLSVLKQFIGFIAVISLGTVFIMNGPEVFSLINDTSMSVEETIIASGTTITGEYKLDGKDTSKDTITSMMRNKMFDVGVMRPYLFMNYGASNVNTIEGGQKTIDSLLKYTQSVGGKAEKKKEVQKQAKENIYMDKDGAGVGPKLGYALFSIYSTYKIGGVILIIASINFISQIATIVCFFLLVLSIFLSMIPKFQNSWYKPLTTAIGAIFLKGLAVFFILLLYVIIRMVDVAIVPDTVGKYICNVILLSFVLNWIKDNRGEIVSAIINKDGGGVGPLINGAGGVDPAKQAKRFTRNRMAEYMMLSRILKKGPGGKSYSKQEGDDDTRRENKGKDPGKKVRTPTNKKPSASRKKDTDPKLKNKEKTEQKKNPKNNQKKKSDSKTPPSKGGKKSVNSKDSSEKRKNPTDPKSPKNKQTDGKQKPSSSRKEPSIGEKREKKVPEKSPSKKTKSPARKQSKKETKKQEPNWHYPSGKAPEGHSPERKRQEKSIPDVKNKKGSNPSSSRK